MIDIEAIAELVTDEAAFQYICSQKRRTCQNRQARERFWNRYYPEKRLYLDAIHKYRFNQFLDSLAEREV